MNGMEYSDSKARPESADDLAEALQHFLEHDRIEQLTKILKEAARRIGPIDARYLCDAYYAQQKIRIELANRWRAENKSNEVIGWTVANAAKLEARIQRLLGEWAASSRIGEWSQSIHGIGPVLSAGLLAHIDIAKAPTVGCIWRFAGLDPSVEWVSVDQAKKWLADKGIEGFGSDSVMVEVAERLGRHVQLVDKTGEPMKPTKENVAKAIARRPWNGKLKTLCWKIGESFVKVSGSEKDVYGHLYLERKAYEQRKNEAGEYAEQAAATLAKSPHHKQKEVYAQGRLPDGRIHMRCQRWAVKLFLAHWHHVAHEVELGAPPPSPYVIEHMGHSGITGPPNWPMA